MVDEETAKVSDEENSKLEEDEDSDDNYIADFIGTKPGDTPYRRVIEAIEEDVIFENMSPVDAINNRNKFELDFMKNLSPLFHSRQENIPINIKAEVIANWIYLHRSKNEEAAIRNLSRSQIDNILYEFKIMSRVAEKDKMNASMRRSKVTDSHIKGLQEFVEKHESSGFTLVQARHFLMQNFLDIECLSLSTISRLIHSKLKFSYKKLGNTEPKKAYFENKSNLESWWKTLIWLIEGGFYLIYVDEFLVNRNTLKKYGWAQKGKPDRLYQKPPDFKMSFVVAHSQERVEGIMGTSSTFNQSKYIKFLKKLVVEIRQRPSVDQRKIVIVADNCRFHRTKRAQSFFKRERIMWLFIPPYSPEINPCEKMINMIKGYVKSQVSQQRYLKLSL